MNIVLVIIGSIGIFLSVFWLLAGAIQKAKQDLIFANQNMLASGVWQFNTLPILSTMFLFIFKKWIFSIPILLSIFPAILILILERQRFENLNETFFWLLNKIHTFIGGVIVILGPAFFMTLSVTNKKFNSPTILSWYFPLFIVLASIVAYIIYVITGMLILNVSLIFQRLKR